MARQRQIAEIEDSDPVPAEVYEAAENYLTPKRRIAALREKMAGALDVLINKMREHNLSEILIDDQEKKLTLTTKDLVKIKKRKKSESNGDEAEDGED